MSPESATTKPWRQLFAEHDKIAMIAVDEAHCISEWLVVHTMHCYIEILSIDYNFIGVKVFVQLSQDLGDSVHFLLHL